MIALLLGTGICILVWFLSLTLVRCGWDEKHDRVDKIV